MGLMVRLHTNPNGITGTNRMRVCMVLHQRQCITVHWVFGYTTKCMVCYVLVFANTQCVFVMVVCLW